MNVNISGLQITDCNLEAEATSPRTKDTGRKKGARK
jgi:hypothetical protein